MTRLAVIAALAASCAACSVMPPKSFPREAHVDLDRYMGAWYVIAHIPPDATRNSYNSIERYRRTAPGVISTVFTYREGGFEGELQRMEPTGYVVEGTGNAVWGMQFIWPIRLEYTITYVAPDYDTTIVARSDRDMVWIMARTPRIDPATYADLVDRVDAIGYDPAALRRVPQEPLDRRSDL